LTFIRAFTKQLVGGGGASGLTPQTPQRLVIKAFGHANIS